MSNITASEARLLNAAYAAFNARDIRAALATMSQDVSWPKAFKGGFAHGHEAVRDYWTEQWSEIDPRAEPVSFRREEDGRILVDVHLVVRDPSGAVLVDQHVGHRFTLANGLLQGMEVCPLPPAGGVPAGRTWSDRLEA
ncbi:MAG TPA: nuclear transport factor 2 family protein [Tepidisphaeraceae bacterium]|nr:nuclear transport factor 2 family protein [Tepidisphaeraceae bacterium]